MEEDKNGYITNVKIGGEKAWYMLGHAFWSRKFSHKFLEILEREYEEPETKGKLWEHIFMDHLQEISMRIRKYPPEAIYEFDSLDELREFDSIYKPWKDAAGAVNGIQFYAPKGSYRYTYETKKLEVYSNA